MPKDLTKLFTDIDFPDTLKYSSDSEHVPLTFYEEAFPKAKTIDLLLGYFSTNAFNALSSSFAEFIYNGGSMRIITNHYYALRDKEELFENVNLEFEDRVITLNDIKNLERTFSKRDHHFFDCLRYLLKVKRLQIRPVIFNNVDLSHSKEMILWDGKNWMSTAGSINFTTSAILRNSESFEVNVSWEKYDFLKARIDQAKEKFEKIFIGDHQQYRHLKVDEIEAVIHKTGTNKELDELLEDSIELNNDTEYGRRVNKIMAEKKKRFSHYVAKLKEQPKFPFTEGPRGYQEDAYEAWVKNGRKGLFAMATGTGKTITSLYCALEDFKVDGFYRILVLVPSLPLASQWKKEASKEFGFREVIMCSSKSKTWEEDLRVKSKSTVFGNQTNFCVIATYATFKGERFQSAFFKLLGSKVKTVTLIADEAHTMGSRGILKKLPYQIEKRIGLSATPDRVYDAHGTSELERFFDAYSPSYTFRYTMKEAIENEVLCPYNYFPVFFELTESELSVYQAYTEKLKMYIDSKTGKYKDSSVVNNLLIQRKNVIHKAKNKLPKLFQIINEIGAEKFHFGFIYVPEGYEPNYEKVDDFNLSDGDAHLIDLYTQFLYSNFKFSLKSFTGETKNRDEILDLFSKGKYDAVLAMKCLDEGVDVPRAEYAIFCASTGNPRQFIQRRGRVLRSHPKKDKAIIYDLIAAPLFDKFQIERSQVETEKNIFRTELRRVINFAALADNCSDLVKAELAKVCRKLDIDLAEELLAELKTYE